MNLVEAYKQCWSISVSGPLCTNPSPNPIVTLAVAHYCHGTTINFTAKRKPSWRKGKDSQQKEKPHGKRKASRQKEKPRGKKKKTHGKKNLAAKRKRFTAKRRTSQQKEKDLRQNFFDVERTFQFLFLLPWDRGYSFCRESFSLAMRLFFLPWG